MSYLNLDLKTAGKTKKIQEIASKAEIMRFT